MKTRNTLKHLILSTFILLAMGSCNKKELNSPAVQIEFEKARDGFFKSYVNAPNDIKKSEVFNQSRLHTCEFETNHGRKFTDWSGVIDVIMTDQGGSEIESFKIKSESQGRTIYYEERGIRKGSSLYNQIAELVEGDDVYFTFKFNEEVASTNEKECFDEKSLTEYGSLDEPEFGVSFSNITKIKQSK